VMGDGYGPMGRGNGPGWNDERWERMHDGIGWGGWLLMVLLLLILVGLIVGIVLLLMRSTSSGRAQPGAGPAPGGESAAQQVLDERYARGEIEEEEYLRRRSVMRGGG
jgi:putative membrane protein